MTSRTWSAFGTSQSATGVPVFDPLVIEAAEGALTHSSKRLREIPQKVYGEPLIVTETVFPFQQI